MTDELPTFVVGRYKKRTDMPKDWNVYLRGFSMVEDHFNADKKKPVFEIEDPEEQTWFIDVSKSLVNDVKSAFKDGWKDKLAILNTFETEVEGKTQLGLTIVPAE